jgi:chemotaxis protein histidine kinase CheA/CheY-like chemotaxis protein
MNLRDLISALSGEIEEVLPDLDTWAERLLTGDPEDPGCMEALDRYLGQIERIASATGMAGYAGLQAFCGHLGEHALAATSLPRAARAAYEPVLRGWPALLMYYLANSTDASAAAGLIDHLRVAPDPISEERALELAHLLYAEPIADPALLDDGSPPRPLEAQQADVDLAVPADVDQKLFDGFLHEGPQQAAEFCRLAQNIAAGRSDGPEVVAAKRFAHTLKGSASIIGIRGIAALGHHVEDILDYLEREGGRVPPALAEVLLDAGFCLEQMVASIVGDDEPPANARAVLQAVLDLANRIDRGEPFALAAAPAQETAGPPETAPPAPAGAAGTPPAALRVPVKIVDDLFRVAGEMSVRMGQVETRVKRAAQRTVQLRAQGQNLQKRLIELENLVDLRALSMMRARSRRGEQSDFDPLEFDQYNELHGAAHALMEDAADARVLGNRLEEDLAQLGTVVAQQQRLQKDLQHLVASTRMTPVGALASRLQRNVRQTCQATGKDAELIIEGSEIQVDGLVLSQLAEPLLHMLRNAVDHGIESLGERVAAGKSARGRIVLSFSRQGQQAVVRCSDDGHGLDLAAIRAHALERGLVSADTALSDEEASRLIFAPGFSTRSAVTEISGRGVGLDVVREWVDSMSGTLHVASRQGAGCALELRFPASLTTAQALVFEAAGQAFAAPVVTIVQAVARGVGGFATVGKDLVFQLGGSSYVACRFAELVGLATGAQARPVADCDVVLARTGVSIQAFAVDRLLDVREVLIKEAGRYVRHLPGVAGLTILGDGAVAAFVDLAQLSRHALTGQGQTQAPRALRPEQAGPSVLIVDDSLSVRNSLQQLILDAGFRAQTARDGLEAVEALRQFRPDVVLTDLEMPNMNGLELTSHIRGREDLKGLPVIMVTSRSQEKHRHQAEQAGVSRYVTKPYNESMLLEAIRQVAA